MLRQLYLPRNTPRNLIVVQTAIGMKAPRIQTQRDPMLRLRRRRRKVERTRYPIPTQGERIAQEPLLLREVGVLRGRQGLQAGELWRE